MLGGVCYGNGTIATEGWLSGLKRRFAKPKKVLSRLLRFRWKSAKNTSPLAHFSLHRVRTKAQEIAPKGDYFAIFCQMATLKKLCVLQCHSELHMQSFRLVMGISRKQRGAVHPFALDHQLAAHAWDAALVVVDQ
jgi:hypothetical protein